MTEHTDDPARPDVRDLRVWVARLLPERGVSRVLAMSSLIASVGSGLYIAGSAVYFVNYVDLSPAQVGLGLSIGGLGGLLLGPVLGQAADRVGPRAATMLFTAAQVIMLVFAGLIHSFPLFLVVIVALGIADSGEAVSRGALIGALLGKEHRVRLSAYLRSVWNLGFTLGVFFAGLALGLNTRPAYLSLIWGHALILIIVLTVYLKVPAVPPTSWKNEEARGTQKVSALRDLPYFAVAQVSGITRLGDTVFTVALPLWIVRHTDAPRALAAWIIALNTIMIILLQVRAAKGAETVHGATRIQKWSFLALTSACLVAGATGRMPTVAAILTLLVAVVLITFGEMWGEAARWSLRYELAPAHAQGLYGGVFRLGQLLPTAAGPLLVTSLTDKFGFTGWAVIAAVFVVGSLASRPIIDWAIRTRSTEGVTAGT